MQFFFIILQNLINRLTWVSYHLRFWAVQILFVGTPSIVFMVYAMHVMATIPVQATPVIPHNNTSSQACSNDTERHDLDSGKSLIPEAPPFFDLILIFLYFGKLLQSIFFLFYFYLLFLGNRYQISPVVQYIYSSKNKYIYIYIFYYF